MEPLGRNETQLHGSWPKPAIFKWKIICYIIFICQEWVYSRQMNWMSNSPKKGRGSGSFKQSVWDEFAATVRRQMLSTVLFHIFFPSILFSSFWQVSPVLLLKIWISSYFLNPMSLSFHHSSLWPGTSHPSQKVWITLCLHTSN